MNRVLVAILFLFLPASSLADDLFDIKPVADGIYAAIAKPAYKVNCNAAIIILGDSVLVVDTHSKPSAARALIDQIKKLFAHPQALAQCRAWVQNNLPRVEIIETSSNARSAELASTEGDTAAIAGLLAAEKYGLRVVEYDIQDNAANATRFLVLGRQCSPPTGRDRTSLMISLVDKVGALHRALAAFRRYRLNMTKIESRPSKRKAWEYFFFIDCDGHASDHRVAKAIAELEQQCSFVKVLGSYPNTE